MNNYIPNISKLKYKKPRKFKGHRGSYGKGFAIKTNKLAFGSYGFQALEGGFLVPSEIEACRRAIVKKLKKEGKLWIRCYPYKPFTSKGLGQRMGSGKGSITKWTFPVKKGQILFEIDSFSKYDVLQAFRSVKFKLSVKIKIKN